MENVLEFIDGLALILLGVPTMLKINNSISRLDTSKTHPKEPVKYTYNGGYVSLPKDRQLKIGLKIFNDAIKGNRCQCGDCG